MGIICCVAIIFRLRRTKWLLNLKDSSLSCGVRFEWSIFIRYASFFEVGYTAFNVGISNPEFHLFKFKLLSQIYLQI